MDNYFEINRESNSGLSGFIKGQNISPKNYKFQKENPMEATAAMILGTAVHLLTLPGQDFYSEFFVFDESKRPDPLHTMLAKENKDWKADIILNNEGKNILTLDQFSQAQNMAESLIEEAGEYINAKGNKFEVPIMWEKLGIKMKAKIDIQNPEFLADIKTAADSSPFKWQRKGLWDFHYYRQASTYLDGDADGLYTGEKEFYFLVVESKPPYLVSIHLVEKTMIAKGMTEYEHLLGVLAECLKTDKWPHYEKELFNWEN